MKKNFNKIASLVLAAAMVGAMPVTAFAANETTVNVTVENDSKINGHTFSAYQILTGTQADGNNTQLADPKWGNGINVVNFITALKTDDTTKSVFADLAEESTDATAEAFVAALSKETNDSEVARRVAKIAEDNKTNGTAIEDKATLTKGYYLIVDTTKVDGANAVQNASVLSLTSDIDIKSKTDKPEVEKKVGENTKYQQADTSAQDSKRTYESGDNDTADYEIGQDVPFTLYSKVPDMSRYDTYYFEFTDNMAESLDLNENSVKVKNTSDGTTYVAGKDYTLTPSAHGFSVVFTDLKKVSGADKGDELTVDFTAKLNEKAAIGQGTVGESGEGNVNKAHIVFSNQPDSNGHGQTEDDKVIVFTYELDFNKYDNDTLDAIPTGANAADYVKVTIDGQTKYRKKLTGAEFQLLDSTKKKYVVLKDGKVSSWTDDASKATTITSTTNEFKIQGLDDGTYYLKETKAPEGYNLLKDTIKLELKAETTNGHKGSGAVKELTSIKLNDVEGNVTTGTVTDDVLNTQGSQLPTTGGMGTTILYVAGAILVIAGAAVLVIKKRHEA